MIINLRHCYRWLIIINIIQSSQILLKVKSWRHWPAIVKISRYLKFFFIWPCIWNGQTLAGVLKMAGRFGTSTLCLCVFSCARVRVCIHKLCSYIPFITLSWTSTIMYTQFLYFVQKSWQKNIHYEHSTKEQYGSSHLSRMSTPSDAVRTIHFTLKNLHITHSFIN